MPEFFLSFFWQKTLAYTYKLQPTKAQIEIIEHNLAICKSVWNHALYFRKLWYNSRQCDINKCSLFSEYIVEPSEYPNYHTQSSQLTQAKKTNPWLKSGNAQAMQQTLRKLERAFNDMRSKGMGFPRYKKKMKSFNLLSNKLEMVENYLKMPLLKNIKLRKSRDIPDGSHIKQVHFTSQICPNCGTNTGKKDLSIRLHSCPECLYERDRDIAAAEMVCKRSLEAAVGTPVLKLPSDGVLAGAKA